ncbi:response regulator [Fibrella sp. USSR17]
MADPNPAFDQFNPIYRIAFENSNQGFCLIEKVDTPAGAPPDFRYLLTNHAFDQQSGLLQVVGKTIRQVVPTIEGYVTAYYEEVALQGTTVNFDAYVSTLGRWMDVRAFRVEANHPLRVAVLFVDITASKQAQADRYQSEAQANFLLQLSDAMRPLTDPIGIQLTANQLALRYFKADRAYYCEIEQDQVTVRQQAARPDLPAIPAQYSLDQLPSMKAQLLKGKSVVIADATTTEAIDQSLKQLCKRLNIGAYIQVPLIRHGQLVAKFCLTQARPRDWTSLDIQLATETAERTWDLAQRARTEVALRQSEAKYRTLFQTISEAICLIERLPRRTDGRRDYRYIAMNSAMLALFNITDLSGQSIREHFPQEIEDWYDDYDRVLDTGQSIRFERLSEPQGMVLEMSISRVEDGSKHRLLVLMQDISTRKQAEQVLKLADRRKNEFLAMLAHELRNPMATLRNGLNILSEIHEVGSIPDQTTGMMTRQLEHLVRLVDDLLDVSRISQGKIELKRERLELGTLVAEVVDSIRPMFATQHKSLQLIGSADPLMVDGDATRLSQLVSNLLTNGVRYTGEQGQVRVSLAGEQGQAVLRIADNGIGLTPDQCLTIFELFVQADTSLVRSQGGLGIGLTLAQRLAQLHGGRIDVHSAGLGQGSEFTVFLPLLAPLTPAITSLDATASSKPVGHRLLVIDDNADGALTLSILLKLRGFAVTTALSGAEGLQVAQVLQPRVILCDISMPGMDGYEVCRRLRGHDWGKSMVLIALTGYGQDEDRQRTKEASFDAHLVKPLDMGVLMQLLTKLLVQA